MAKTYTTLKNVTDAENWGQVNYRIFFHSLIFDLIANCKLKVIFLKDDEAVFMEDLAAVYTYVEEQIR